MKTKLIQQESKVDKIKETVIKAGHNNNDIIQMMNAVEKETSDKNIAGIIVDAEALSERMKKLSKEIDKSDEASQLREKLKKLALDWDTKTSLAEENVTKVLRNLTDSEGQLAKLNKILEHNQERLNNSKIPDKIQELRNKIAKAQHAADGVNITVNQYVSNFSIIISISNIVTCIAKLRTS